MTMSQLQLKAFSPLLFYVVIFCAPLHVNSHGRLMDPPSRSSLWRLEEFRHLPLEINYDDSQLFCGGAYVQHGRNKGRCGECGDPYHLQRPRDNESGGKYGKGIITRTYKEGQVIVAKVEISSNHNGNFEFRICPLSRMYDLVEQSCLDKYVLRVHDTGATEYPIGQHLGWYNVSLDLPPGVKSKHAVFQWHYSAANSWGRCANGTEAVGCGPQETFRGCADIQII